MSWQKSLKDSFTTQAALCEFAEIEQNSFTHADTIKQNFPIRVPQAYAQRIEKKNPNDPLLKQVIFQANELLEVKGFNKDPLAENAANKVPGLLHKYHGRVLLMQHGQCAIHCRYCFRRHFAYQENTPGTIGFERVYDYIQSDPSITEVILSGGDPLISKDEQLLKLIHRLNLIPHLKRLRIHSRIPVVLPERITEELIEVLKDTRLSMAIVIHSNHANEIDEAVVIALQKLKPVATLLNQAVLLKGINDTLEAQQQLHERFYECGVLPYYLHQLDRVEGTAHFEVSNSEARKLYQQMQATLPGYLVPKLAVEEPGKPGKTW